VRCPVVIVVEVSANDVPEMTVIQNDDMIQTVAAQSSDESLHEWVLPRTSRCTEDLLDPHGGVKPTRWTNNCAARLRASRASRSCVAPDREDEAWKLRSSPTPVLRKN
jgi:hypothetical protein